MHDPDPDDSPSPESDISAKLDRLWSDAPSGSPSHSAAPEFDAQTTPSPDLIDGRYQLGKCIGVGSFGLVHQANDTQTQKIVAIKLPRPEVILSSPQLVRFRREADLAMQLNHRGIVRVLGCNFDSGMPYIAMEWCDGLDLGQFLQQARSSQQSVDWRAAATMIAKIARAIEHAHQHDVTHRDLKPSNILLERKPVAAGDQASDNDLDQYEPRVTDFGLAQLVDPELTGTRSSLLIGTPIYLAPEQIERFAGNPSSALSAFAPDIYALGMILFETLAGQPAVSGETWFAVVDSIRSGNRLSLRKLRSDLPKKLISVCECCLSHDPAGRFKSAGELADNLEACLSEKPIKLAKRSLYRRLLFFSRRPQRILQAGLYAMSVHAVLLVWVVFGIGAVLTRPDLYDSLRVPPANRGWLILESIQVILTVHLPMAVIGWYTYRGRGWAIWTGTALSLFSVLLPLLMALGSIELFGDVYRDADYHRTMFATMVFLLMALQLAFFLFALTAHRWKAIARL